MPTMSTGKKPSKGAGKVFTRERIVWAFIAAVGVDLFGYSGDYGAKIMNNTGLRPVASWYCVAGIPAGNWAWPATKSLAIDLNDIVQGNPPKIRRTTSQPPSTYCSTRILR